MANKKINELTEASILSVGDYYLVEQSGVSKKVTFASIYNKVSSLMVNKRVFKEDFMAPASLTNPVSSDAAVFGAMFDTVSVIGGSAAFGTVGVGEPGVAITQSAPTAGESGEYGTYGTSNFRGAQNPLFKCSIAMTANTTSRAIVGFMNKSANTSITADSNFTTNYAVLRKKELSTTWEFATRAASGTEQVTEISGLVNTKETFSIRLSSSSAKLYRGDETTGTLLATHTTFPTAFMGWYFHNMITSTVAATLTIYSVYIEADY